jgi:hypothetical protein
MKKSTRAQINSGFGREPKGKASAPTKPARVGLNSGFLPITSGTGRTAHSTPTVYGRPTGKRKMF